MKQGQKYKVVMKACKDFTEEERETFAENFYYNWLTAWGKTDLALGSPSPWGCPWCYCEDKKFDVNQLDVEATEYFKVKCHDIYDQIREERFYAAQESRCNCCPGWGCSDCLMLED